MYLNLNSDKISDTIKVLQRRIGERFAFSGLNEISLDLVAVSDRSIRIAAELVKPYWSLRVAIIVAVVAAVAVFGLVLTNLNIDSDLSSFSQFIQITEAATNILLLLGASIFFLFSLERRLKRQRAHAAIHELRSLAHIIDMHQLTKDPERMSVRGADTESSPKRRPMTTFEMSRYLDYCSEMLAMLSKVAALFAQNCDDQEVLAEVDAVETLTSGLSRKIWQKLIILQSIKE